MLGAGSTRLSISLALAIVVGCTPAAPTIPFPSAEQPRSGGRFVVATAPGTEPLTLNPVLNNFITPAIDLIYAKLVEPDPKTGEIKPNLASWSLAADGRTYDWSFVSTAMWSDGVPVTGRDVATGVKGFARTKQTAHHLWQNFAQIVGFEDYAAGRATDIAGIVGDGAQMRVTLRQALCPALASLFQWASPIPAHVFGKYLSDDDPSRTLQGAPENDAPPVASGPFLLAEWRKGDGMLLRRNARYFRGAPLLDEYEIRVVPHQRVLDELNAGRIHWLPLDLRATAPVAPQVRQRSFPDNGYTYIGWNLRRSEALRDARVRRALAYGLDTDRLIQEIVRGAGTKAVSHHPPATWVQASGLEPYPYDPAQAEELLRSAGYQRGPDGFFARDGRALALTIVTNRGNAIRAEFLQAATDQYQRIGVRIVPQLEDFAPLTRSLTLNTFGGDGFIIGWSLDVDPDPYGIWHSKGANNFVGYSDPAVDRAIELARHGPDCSVAARRQHYQRVNRVLNADQPYNFGFVRTTTIGLAPELEDVVVDTFAALPVRDVHRWWFKR